MMPIKAQRRVFCQKRKALLFALRFYRMPPNVIKFFKPILGG